MHINTFKNAPTFTFIRVTTLSSVEIKWPKIIDFNPVALALLLLT